MFLQLSMDKVWSKVSISKHLLLCGAQCMRANLSYKSNRLGASFYLTWLQKQSQLPKIRAVLRTKKTEEAKTKLDFLT